MIKKIGIFYGCDIGNVRYFSNFIYKKIKRYFYSKIFNISKSEIYDLNKFDILILGTYTSYYGNLQKDWKGFFVKNKSFILKSKIVAFFGIDNQFIYSNVFCDGVYKLYISLLKNNNNFIVLGNWYLSNYNFFYSKTLLNKNYSLGLLLDENSSNIENINKVNKWISYLMVEIFKL